MRELHLRVIVAILAATSVCGCVSFGASMISKVPFCLPNGFQVLALSGCCC